MLVSKSIEIDMAHALTYHKSKCRGLHGHRYRIEAFVNDKVIATEGDSSFGMVIDFADLKQSMMDIIDRYYDHGFVIYSKDDRAPLLRQTLDIRCFEKERYHEVDFEPTAENLAKYWFNLLDQKLKNDFKIKLVRLDVWETPTSCATYTIEDL